MLRETFQRLAEVHPGEPGFLKGWKHWNTDFNFLNNNFRLESSLFLKRGSWDAEELIHQPRNPEYQSPGQEPPSVAQVTIAVTHSVKGLLQILSKDNLGEKVSVHSLVNQV